MDHLNHHTTSDEDSSVRFLDQDSEYNSFFSSHTHHSSLGCDSQKIPNSIFLDDVTNRDSPDHNMNNDMQLHENDSHQYSDVDIENLDDHWQDHDLAFDNLSHHDDDVTIHSGQSSSDVPNLIPPSYSNRFTEHQHHRFDRISREETASYQIMTLLDTSGAPRNCYDRLVALLKKLTKKEGFDIQRALNRETLMKRLASKYKAQPKIQSITINKQQVFRFTFEEMLQDLVHSSSQHLHEILPTNREHFKVPEKGSEHELWNTSWMRNTFAMEEYRDFDDKNDIMLPIILYMDKTGTDVNQRYSLEPVLFSVAAIPRQHRESRHSWRHLGFIPQRGDGGEESSSYLQTYHDCLSYLLEGLREAQKNPPTLTVQFKNTGSMVRRKAILPLMIVMGDQLSQDTLCGRLKSNSGGAGRVHRNCMCSYLNIDDPYHTCKQVNLATLNLLTTYATTTDEAIDTMVSSAEDSRISKSYLMKQRTMFRSILRHPYTTHPISNAFKGINFGSWTAGIHDATVDDFMHSVEGGMVSYITYHRNRV